MNTRTLWLNEEVGHNRTAKAEIKALFPGENPFSTPKPEALLHKVITAATAPGDIVLDCFAGSGTTAAVAQKLGRRWVACELLETNFARYTRPRLEKVVAGHDPGGVSITSFREAADSLPEKMSPDEAAEFQTALTRVTKHVLDGDEAGIPINLAKQLAKIVRADGKAEQPALPDEKRKEMLRTLNWVSKALDVTVDLGPEARKALNSATRTRPKTEINWRGGGGFQIARLAPACFDYDPDLGAVTLTGAADDLSTLTASVAAHLRFRLTPEHRNFDGVRGRMRLFVTRTPLTPAFVEELTAHLGEGESLTVASTVVLDGAAQALREASRGSRVLHIPHDLFKLPKEAAR